MALQQLSKKESLNPCEINPSCKVIEDTGIPQLDQEFVATIFFLFYHYARLDTASTLINHIKQQTLNSVQELFSDLAYNTKCINVDKNLETYDLKNSIAS